MLDVRHITFSYADKPVIEDVSFSVSKGQQVSVIGESGCGKSTLLKLIYGLYDLDKGEISFNGKPVLGPKDKLIPGDDDMKYLAQDFGLMPFTTVAENVGNFLSNIDKGKKRERIAELLEMVEMTEFADIKAQYLSGGQQQRTALAKVLALEPKLLLLDEPFSQIDNFRANSLRRNLFKYFREKEITCLIATHDNADVLSFSDTAIVMRDGKLVSSGAPKAIYENPADRYVASLLGDVNEIEPEFVDIADRSEKVFVYPHQLKITERSKLRVTVSNSWFKGSVWLVEGIYEKGKILFENPAALPNGVMVCLKKV